MLQTTTPQERELEIWDPNVFTRGEHFAMTITAPREQGKSTLFRDIFIKTNMRDLFDVHVLFSKTLNEDFYGEFFPGDGRLMFRGYDPNRLKKIITMAEAFHAKHGRWLNILIAFDDCVGESDKVAEGRKLRKNIKNENEILELFTMGRHKGLTIIFLTQSPTLIDSNWRKNTNIHVVLYSPDENDKEHIYNNALAGVDVRRAKWADGTALEIPAGYRSQIHVGPPKKKFMLDLYERTCRDYTAIVVNTRPAAAQPIAKYRATIMTIDVAAEGKPKSALKSVKFAGALKS